MKGKITFKQSVTLYRLTNYDCRPIRDILSRAVAWDLINRAKSNKENLAEVSEILKKMGATYKGEPQVVDINVVTAKEIPMTEKRKVNSISHIEFHKLTNEIAARQEDILERRPSRIEVAKEMSELMTQKLGYEIKISDHSITDSFKALGIKYERKTVGRPRSTNYDKIKDLRKRTMRVIVESVIKLYQDVGGTPPEELMLAKKIYTNGVPRTLAEILKEDQTESPS